MVFVMVKEKEKELDLETLGEELVEKKSFEFFDDEVKEVIKRSFFNALGIFLVGMGEGFKDLK